MQKVSNSVPREQNKMHNCAVPPYCLSASEKLCIMEALDHLHVTRQYQEMGCCVVCKKITIKKCSGCDIFYCSSECQTFDWPKHQISCSKHREYFSDSNSFASSIRKRKVSSVKNFNEDGLILTDRNSPFTALANQLSRKSANLFNGNKSLSNFKIGNKQYQNKERTSVSGVKEHKKTNSNNRNNEKKKKNSPKKSSSSSKKSSPDEKKKINSSDFKNTKLNSNNKIIEADECIPASCTSKHSQKSQTNLQKIGRMEVVCTYRESSNRYWVMDIQNVSKYEKIQLKLNNECENYEEITPKLGLVCGGTYADEWYRVKVDALTPEVRVHFIDFGNRSNCEKNVFKKLPNDLQSMPGLVFLIEFEEDTPDKYRTLNLDSLKIMIEETAKASDGVPVVKVIDGMNEAATSETSTKSSESKKTKKFEFSKRGCAMDSLKPNSQGMLFLLPGKSVLRFASIVPEDNDSAKDCVKKVLNIDNPNSDGYEAKEGEVVLVTDKEGNDQRGRVIGKIGSTRFVQLIDCGNVISTETVYAIPEELKHLVELGVRITVEEVFLEDEMGKTETCFFTVTGEPDSGKWPCILKNTNEEVIAKVLLEKPERIMEWKPQYVRMPSGSTVEISSICDSKSFYVRSVDAETEHMFLGMNMEMMELIQKAKPFSLPPLVGELCCAKFEEDDCFYRAIITSVEDDIIFVMFVDFGNEQKTYLNDILPLPVSLQKIPFFALKVKLKNVFTKVWNNMIKDYIGKLLSENVELTMTYDKSIANGVILREKLSGVVVNDFIEKSKDKVKSDKEEREFPLSKKGEIFLDDDLKYTTVTSGSEHVVALLYVNEGEFISNYTFWATVADSENFSYVNGDLSALICEHCTKDPKPYNPSYRELCLAEYEGSWYRAMCAGSNDEYFKVFFIDFGNFCELKATSIRKMTYEFLKAPALALSCTLKGRDRLKGNPELTKEVCLILLDKINTLITGVTVTKFKEDTFSLEIPDIEAILSD